MIGTHRAQSEAPTRSLRKAHNLIWRNSGDKSKPRSIESLLTQKQDKILGGGPRDRSEEWEAEQGDAQRAGDRHGHPQVRERLPHEKDVGLNWLIGRDKKPQAAGRQPSGETQWMREQECRVSITNIPSDEIDELLKERQIMENALEKLENDNKTLKAELEKCKSEVRQFETTAEENAELKSLV